MPSDSPGIPGWFIAIFVIVGVIAIGGAIWRATVLRQGGLNPFVAKEQLESKLAQSQMMAPPSPERTTEQRLADIDDLRDRGVITEDEHSAARAKIISGS